MSIYEFDEKLHERSIKEYTYEEGLAAGHAAGLSEGELRKLISMLINLLDNNDSWDIIHDIMVNKLKQPEALVHKIYLLARKKSPEYNIDRIYEELTR